MSASPPIACTLPPLAFAKRVSWIASVNRAFLRSHCYRAGMLELTYAPAARSQLQALIERERECCAFLRFDLREREEALDLRIEVPSSVGRGAALLLDVFLQGASAPNRSDARPARRRESRVGRLTWLGSAAAALLVGVCCVLPLLFSALALTALAGIFVAFARAYWWMIVIALAAAAGGWFLIARRRSKTR